ncbi:MAG: hypothetical protein A3F17_06325 [Gammaproteobacteria bacterium RIFCSPHIGHO2_12_FULL_41_15]|nr:MAG: hypothetical protein A3F17_06325 [Gammaproteobacteria bacterium RIFCSPHIGHO2_12_FULL_41_15]
MKKKSIIVLSFSLFCMASVFGTTKYFVQTKFANQKDAVDKPMVEESFSDVLAAITLQAKKEGVSETVIKKYLTTVKPFPEEKSALTSKMSRAEIESHKFSIPDFRELIADRISKKTVDEFLSNNKKNLLLISKKYQVPPQYILVMLGLESEFGRNVGKKPLLQALVNTAYEDKERRNYFSQLAVDALKILEKSHPVLPQQLKSTFDGGMGIPQFEPSTYLELAVSFAGNGQPNIWTNMNDAMASTANFLHQLGWRENESWGYPVLLPNDSDQWVQLAKEQKEQSIADWLKLGIKFKVTPEKVDNTLKAELLLPYGVKGPAFLVLHNYHVLKLWNASTNESVATGLLADEYEKDLFPTKRAAHQ